MDVWIHAEAQKVKQLASIPEVRTLVSRLVQTEQEQGFEALKSLPLGQQLQQIISINAREYKQDYYVINPKEGYILSDPNHPNYIGVQYGEWIWRKVQELKEKDFVFTYPLTANEYTFEKRIIEEYPSRSGSTQVAFTAPILDERAQILAQLSWIYEGQHLFDTLLLKNRPGLTGDVYAFNEFGYFLNNTDLLEQLKEMNMLVWIPFRHLYGHTG